MEAVAERAGAVVVKEEGVNRALFDKHPNLLISLRMITRIN